MRISQVISSQRRLCWLLPRVSHVVTGTYDIILGQDLTENRINDMESVPDGVQSFDMAHDALARIFGNGAGAAERRAAAVDSALRATAATDGPAEGRSPSTTRTWYEYTARRSR